MSDDDETVEEKVAALPAVPKAFIEGYGVSVGQLPDPAKEGYASKRSRFAAPEGYDLNLGGSTNRICVHCGAVVADFDRHDEFHDSLVTKDG